MTALAALTHRLFDYAGMFPPAALSFEDALRESAGFPTALARPDLVAADIVLVPSEFARLTPDALAEAGFGPGRSCTVCLVGVHVDDGEAMARLAATSNMMRADAAVPVRVVSLELHTDDPIAAIGPVRAARSAAEGIQVYLEPKWTPEVWAGRGGEVWRTLDVLRDAGSPVGLKVRCAGPTALDAATLAHVLPRVAARRIPFKATQGLHHPFAGDVRYDNAHGFLNVAVALRLLGAGALPLDEVAACLSDPEPASFRSDAGLGWREHRILTQRVHEAVRDVPFTIGSCSLAEPDTDLGTLAD